ncbi:subtilisin-like serine protease [Synechococcus phage S-WAM2]|uniref:Subtilisin-like serine protease n=1 Tax=Synechococcus phage S-WAM2 TaxID=1815522 RepID=A0A1D8KT68_9CAUD|nr:subtilisin-like serine protease [Synechococcus phage S-WAM2]AOV61888.1 subtilisin-like serine protease [Synechococcus phage S-WAM2]
MDKEYVVTLHRKEDLEQFYNEMKLTNFPLVMKRPLSRNTHYMMTEEQAEQLRQDPRVWGVEALDSFQLKPQVNNEPYTIAGDFFKNAPQGSTINSNMRQWGHLHCAGDQAQRRKNNWGDPTSTEVVNDQVEVFNNGRHVDVVIVDDPVSYDSKEWESPSQPGVSRFVQYQWFNELNSIVNSIDDDNQTEPTGTITYGTNAASASYHGIHVTGTAAGQHYGWAEEANIYNLAVTDSWPSGQQVGSLLIFDYLRAFHLNKAINPETGNKNPTVTNHSYGGVIPMPNDNLTFGDLTQVVYQGVVYNAGNPGPSGWTQAGVEADFGLRFGVDTYPAWSSAVAADVQDAIDDGVVIIGAAGNDNMLMAEVNDENWNNLVTITGVGTIYLNRGAWPNSPDSGAINVGALSDHSQFRRSTYTQFGPAIDVFAPGDDILSSYGNTGFIDQKYGSGNYYYPIPGTSMASPQVCGVIACLATGKERFTQADARAYLDQYSIYGDMTFDVAGGGLNDNSCRQGSPNKYLHIENPRKSVGYVAEVVGERTSGMTFPRPRMYHQA